MNDERRMPFVEHLVELRDRLRNSILAVFFATIGCYIFRGYLFRLMARPLLGAFQHAKEMGVVGRFVIINPMEGFMVLMKTALVAAIFIASPVIFMQLWGFIAPGLHRHEKRWAVPFVLSAVVLFVGGGLFCYYFVLPPGYQFFLTATREATVQLQHEMGAGVDLVSAMDVQPMISMDEYFGLTLMLLLVFGAVFELPLILAILSMLGVVSAKSLWKFNRYAILLFAIAGAILTPGDLVIGQLAMTGSLTVLYNLSIIVAWLVQRRRAPQAPEESTELAPPA